MKGRQFSSAFVLFILYCFLEVTFHTYIKVVEIMRQNAKSTYKLIKTGVGVNCNKNTQNKYKNNFYLQIYYTSKSVLCVIFSKSCKVV